ncbi:hypothetical protein [Ferruginibacter sp.]|nr:hypothetical protein [Ferruginibacter sp.]
MEKRPVTSSAKSIAKNIGIGVVTPVLAATIIYFLGFNKNDDADFKKKKEATVQTWNVFIQNKGIFSTVMKQLASSNDLEVTRKNINHEIDVTIENMENIKKEPNADQRVYSTIDITAQQIKEIKPLMNKFLDDILAYAAKDPTEEEGKAYILQLGEGLKTEMAGLRQRDSIRLAVFYDGLNKDYNVTLSKN